MLGRGLLNRGNDAPRLVMTRKPWGRLRVVGWSGLIGAGGILLAASRGEC